MAGLGGGAIIAIGAALWLLYLTPAWLRRRQYIATERTAVRLQQTLRVLAETAEMPDEVRAELSARSVAEQHRALRDAARHAETVARPLEAAAERSLVRGSTPAPREPRRRADAVAVVARARLRRTQVLSGNVLLLSLAACALGGSQVTTTVGLTILVAGVLGVLVGLALLQRAATVAAAHRAVEAVDRAVPVTEVPQTFVDWQRSETERPTWTPVPLPKPLYLQRDEVAEQPSPAITAAAAASLRAAAAEADEALRAAQAAPEIATLEPRGPHPAFAALGIQETGEPMLGDLDAVLRRRRAG
jgi:hypothetical protein